MLQRLAKIISWISLAALLAPSLLFLAGSVQLDRVKTVMLIATMAWFASAGLSMWNNDARTPDDNESLPSSSA